MRAQVRWLRVGAAAMMLLSAVQAGAWVPRALAQADQAVTDSDTPISAGESADPGPGTVDTNVTPALRPLLVAPPKLEELPGVLLVASSRENPGAGDSTARYRLYTLRQGQFTRVHYPDDELGSTSAALSQNGRRLLVNAAGQALYVVDVTGAMPPQQLLGRLPPLSFTQTDAYLSVAWSADEMQAVVVPSPPARYEPGVDTGRRDNTAGDGRVGAVVLTRRA